MKINQFNTTIASNIPKCLKLRDPFNGELIKDEAGDTLDIYVYGAHSDQSRNALNAKNRKNKDAMSNEEAEEVGAEYLASITQGWGANFEGDDGVQIKFGHKQAVELYKTQDWIAAQVNKFSINLGNYDPKR